MSFEKELRAFTHSIVKFVEKQDAINDKLEKIVTKMEPVNAKSVRALS